jgi:hypothetical protein
MVMRIFRIALMLLAVFLLIGTGIPSPSGQHKAGTKINKQWPTCPPDCVS